jgi:predicted nucleic acid-binding protein
MVVLDTNVISELMRPDPSPAVTDWIASQPRKTLYTTTISQAEILYGIALLPKGRRRDKLAAAAEAVFDEDLAGRVLAFHTTASACYARIMASRRHSGSPLDAFDGLIAAIALATGAGVATRDVKGFEECGLTMLIDPWNAPCGQF